MAQWPLEEALAAYRQHLKTVALDQFRHEDLRWAAMFGHLAEPEKARPKPPPIIQEIYRGSA